MKYVLHLLATTLFRHLGASETPELVVLYYDSLSPNGAPPVIEAAFEAECACGSEIRWHGRWRGAAGRGQARKARVLTPIWYWGLMYQA